MQQNVLVIIFLFATLGLNAQKNVTINSDLSGTLNTNIKCDILKIQELTISGKIDARDFLIIKKMSELKTLNLKDVQIEAYSGKDWNFNDTCKSNTIPDYAFSDPSSGEGFKNLERISLPATLVSIGENAFSNCLKLKEIKINSIVFPKFAISSFNGLETSKCKLYVTKCNRKNIEKMHWGKMFKVKEL